MRKSLKLEYHLSVLSFVTFDLQSSSWVSGFNDTKDLFLDIKDVYHPNPGLPSLNGVFRCSFLTSPWMKSKNSQGLNPMPLRAISLSQLAKASSSAWLNTDDGPLILSISTSPEDLLCKKLYGRSYSLEAFLNDNLFLLTSYNALLTRSDFPGDIRFPLLYFCDIALACFTAGLTLPGVWTTVNLRFFLGAMFLLKNTLSRSIQYIFIYTVVIKWRYINTEPTNRFNGWGSQGATPPPPNDQNYILLSQYRRKYQKHTPKCSISD